MNLRTGVVILPDLSWEQRASAGAKAEQRGFHTAWTYDHLSWRTLRDGPWLGAVPLLAAAAEITDDRPARHARHQRRTSAIPRCSPKTS